MSEAKRNELGAPAGSARRVQTRKALTILTRYEHTGLTETEAACPLNERKAWAAMAIGGYDVFRRQRWDMRHSHLEIPEGSVLVGKVPDRERPSLTKLAVIAHGPCSMRVVQSGRADRWHVVEIREQNA